MKPQIILLFVLVSVSCSAKRDPGIESAREALEKLQRIQAATQVGVNQVNYVPMLIAAKASVNNASKLLPDGALKKELNEGMNAYEDAAAVWQIEEVIYSDSESGRELITKYSAPEESDPWGKHFIFPNKAIGPICAPLMPTLRKPNCYYQNEFSRVA